MSSEQNTAPAIPNWIKASLFEPVYKEVFSNFQQIKNFKAKPALSAGENYASVMLRLEAEIELKDGSCKSITLMLKTAHDNELIKETMKSHNVFNVETIMYREVVPELQQLYKEAGVDIQFAPKFYAIATEHPYVLVEDLKPKGYANVNRFEGLDIQHTEAVLTVLAQWHAASAVQVVTKANINPILFETFFKEENRERITKIFDSLTEAFLKAAETYEGHELYYDRLCRHKDVILDEMFEANKLDENEFNVYNHGDCWSNNVMFKHDEAGNVIAYNASTGIMATVLLDPSDNAKLENYFSFSDEAAQFKMELYSNRRYRKHIEMVLPWLYYRGTF